MLLNVPFSNSISKRRRPLFLILIFLWFVLCGDVCASEQRNNSNLNLRRSGKNLKRRKAAGGVLDFNTKMLLVFFSVFMLIFVIVMLVVGHFTWFADIKRKLAKEWEEEQARIKEEDQTAKDILSEMRNPFIDSGLTEDDKYNRRRESLDSSGCSRGLCVPPHHSVLCPNNSAIPSLSDPIINYYQDPIHFHNNNDSNERGSPIDYRRRPSTDWMNLDTCVRVSEPIPLRRDFKLFNMSTGSLIPKLPTTPITPDPVPVILQNNHSSVNTLDPEMGEKEKSNVGRYPSIRSFDISKLDMF